MSRKQRRAIPVFETPIIETHCHLDYLDTGELEETLARSRSVGIDRIITIAVSPDNLQTVINLAGSNQDIWCTQGIHPHEAEKFSPEVAARILESASNDLVVAIGEVGLDYYYDHADRAVQRRVFEEQLQIAVDCDLPVVIHTREADDDTRAILENFGHRLRRGGVIHSFTSSLELAKYALESGFMLGFNGIATFNTAENVREVVSATPLAQLVLETDSPYLTPVPYRGKTNAPYYLPFVAEKIAEIKAVPVESLLQQARANSFALFFPEEL